MADLPMADSTREPAANQNARTTRSRVNFFTNKFRKLGFIEYSGIHVNDSLLSVVLHD
jgi:hypothetical protein